MWSKTENDELVRMWPDHSASEIAAKLGRSRNAVIGRIHRVNGTYAGRIYRDDVERLQQAAERQKLKAEREATALALMRDSLKRKIPRNRAIKLAVERGATLRAVGAVFGITRQAISLIVRQ